MTGGRGRSWPPDLLDVHGRLYFPQDDVVDLAAVAQPGHRGALGIEDAQPEPAAELAGIGRAPTGLRIVLDADGLGVLLVLGPDPLQQLPVGTQLVGDPRQSRERSLSGARPGQPEFGLAVGVPLQVRPPQHGGQTDALHEDGHEHHHRCGEGVQVPVRERRTGVQRPGYGQSRGQGHHVDYATQRRTVKDSGPAYAEVIRRHQRAGGQT